MPWIAHATVLLLPLLAAVGLWRGGWSWSLPVVVFVFIPLVELLVTGSPRNPDADQQVHRSRIRAFDGLIYAAAGAQVTAVLALFWRAPDLVGWDLVGGIVSVGILCGGLGINVGHELGHRADRGNRFLAKLMLLTTLYQHFFIEHNRGHHRRVATPQDPATSRKGEGVYAFWWRSITGGFGSAWALEQGRLGRNGQGWASWANQMVRFTVVQLGALVLVAVIFGPKALVAWLFAALFGVLLLETVNYVEHYGLLREKLPGGRYERVRPVHSWNSNHPLGRVLLFELTRHSDHHAYPARPYPLLRHHDRAPRLPTGYPGMILLALVPPVFQRIMDRQLVREGARLRALAA